MKNFTVRNGNSRSKIVSVGCGHPEEQPQGRHEREHRHACQQPGESAEDHQPEQRRNEG